MADHDGAEQALGAVRNPIIEAMVSMETVTVEAIQTIVDDNPEMLMQRNEDGELPLHCALRLVRPTAVVRFLVDKCPQAVQEATRDDFEYLPAHLACLDAGLVEQEEVTLEILRILLGAYPLALQATDSMGRLPLHVAFRDGFPPLEVLRYVVQSHPPALQARDDNGRVPLHYAVASSRPSLPGIMYLIELAPESVRAKAADGDIPLVFAVTAARASMPVVKCLVSAWPESILDESWGEATALYAGAGNEYTALHAAARWGRLDVAEYFLATVPELLAHAKSRPGDSPLHVAATFGYVRICDLLVRHWPEAVRVFDRDGALPVHAAARNGKKDAVRCLVSQSPDAAHESTKGGWLPIHCAVQYRPRNDRELQEVVEMVRFLVRLHPGSVWDATDRGKLPLHVAAADASESRNHLAGQTALEFVRLLVGLAPTSVRVQSNDGMLPVHCAIHSGFSVPAARFLLQSWPASVGFKTASGDSLLHLAASRQKPMLEFVEVVVEQRASLLDEVNSGGQLPVHYAVRYPSQPLDVVRYLVERRPQSLAHGDLNRALPLHACFDDPQPALKKVKYLVEKYPEALEAKDKYGRLPLHRAVRRDVASLEVVRCLVEERPRSLRTKDNSGWLPLHVAAVSDASLDILFYLASKNPLSLLGEGLSGESPLRLSKRPKLR